MLAVVAFQSWCTVESVGDVHPAVVTMNVGIRKKTRKKMRKAVKRNGTVWW